MGTAAASHTAARLRPCQAVLVGAGFLASGCATMGQFAPAPATQVIDPAAAYRMTLKMKVNGQAIAGLGVAKRGAGLYRVEAQAPADLELLTVSSCRRETILEKVDSKFGFDFTPAGARELAGCPLLIQGLDKEKSRHTLGFLAFDHPDYRLAATSFCDGAGEEVLGSVVCQAREGLVPELRFHADVTVAVEPESCPLPRSLGARAYEFKTARGWCHYVFKRDGAPPEYLRYSLYGYEKVALEKD